MTALALEQIPEEQTAKSWAFAVVVSALIHALLFVGIQIHDGAKPIPIVEVELLKIPTKSTAQKRQMVSPSQAPESTPKKDTRFLSDKDTSARVEQIRRGTENPAIKAQPAPKPASVPPKPAPRETTLKLDSQTLQEKFAKQGTVSAQAGEKAAKPAAEQDRLSKLYEYQPFQKSLSHAIFSGRRGISDYLPQIQDGDITLLNAKADRFAVFVRRVALQVFGNLRRRSWQDVPSTETRRIRDFVTVHAVMNKEGELLGVSLVNGSGSRSFDKALMGAANKGAWDQNPPAAAISDDGKIHFVFKARTWSQRSANSPFESRWLLLATGLL